MFIIESGINAKVDPRNCLYLPICLASSPFFRSMLCRMIKLFDNSDLRCNDHYSILSFC